VNGTWAVCKGWRSLGEKRAYRQWSGLPGPVRTGTHRPSNLAQRESLVIGRRPRCPVRVATAADYLHVSGRQSHRSNCGELAILMDAGSTRCDVAGLDHYIAISRCRRRSRHPPTLFGRDLT